MVEINQLYGYTFSRLCRAKEIKNSDISRKTGISKSTLSKFIKGDLYLRMDQMTAALEAIHVDLAEFGLYLNHFKYNYYERYFSRIEDAVLSEDSITLEKIYEEASQKGERMIALSAKAQLGNLEEDELVEIGSSMISIEIFTFYELAILSNTVSKFSISLIRGVIQDLQHHGDHGKHMLYRGLICQIACRAAMACTNQGQSAQEEASEALALAKSCCREKDIYSRQLYRFVKAYYNLVYDSSSEHARNLEEMKNVIQVFERGGSAQLARYYQKLYDQFLRDMGKSF